MSDDRLEKRVKALEELVAGMRATASRKAAQDDWRSTIGIFTGDEGMKQLFEEAMKLRQRDRAKARARTRRIRGRVTK